MEGKVIALPPFGRDVEVRASSFREEDNSIEVVFTTEHPVRRYSWRDGAYYDEVLDVKPGSIRLDRLNAGAPFLNTHADWSLSDVIGNVVPGSVRIAGGKGTARIALSRAPSDADIVMKIKDGNIRNVSVGYRVHKVEKTERGEGEIAEWRVTDWEPLEISAVPIPADPGAQIRSEGTNTGEASDRLAPCEFVVTRAADETPARADDTKEKPEMADKTKAAEDTASDKTPAPAPAPVADEPAPAPTPSQFRSEDVQRISREAGDAAVRAERERANTIRSLAERSGVRDFGDQHIASGSSVDAFRTALLDHLVETRDTGTIGGQVRASVGIEHHEKRASAMEEALLHRADPAQYQLTEAGREYRSMSLLEIARDALEGRGVKTRGMSRSELAEQALRQRSGGLHTTSDFPLVLANVANKMLRAGYQAMPQTFRPLVRITSVPDFKSVSRVQLGEAPQFDKVNEHGEFTRGTLAEGREQYSIATYGKVVGITRQVIINDDLNAFTRIPQSFGVAASQLESDLVWAQIIGNPTMGDGNTLFHASHKNLGTGGAISLTTMSEARRLMALQTGLDGFTVLGLTANYLVVPVTLQTTAEQFVSAGFVPTQTSNIVPESLRLQVIAEPRLDNGIARFGISGSGAQWYAAGTPAVCDIVEMAYLDGQQGVYTETRTGFDVDGVEVKVRLDVGAKALDWRNLVRNAGS